MRSIRDLLEARLGVATVPLVNRTGGVIGTAPAQVLRQDPSRVGAVVINLSPNTVYLTPRGVPSATNGVQLQANGGGVALHWEDDGEVVANEWQGVASAAASPLYVLEQVIDAGRSAPGGPGAGGA